MAGILKYENQSDRSKIQKVFRMGRWFHSILAFNVSSHVDYKSWVSRKRSKHRSQKMLMIVQLLHIKYLVLVTDKIRVKNPDKICMNAFKQKQFIFIVFC